MPATFQYKVKDKSGKLVQGSLEAENAQLVVSKLRSMGYVPIEIQQQGGSGLQRDLKLSEEEAYLMLQKQSRQRRMSMREVAEAIILNEEIRRAQGKSVPA